MLSVAADKFERRLNEEISAFRAEIRTALHDGLTAVRQEIHANTSSLRAEMATSRVEMLKWSFLFWIGQVAVMAGLLAYMLRR